MKKWSGRMESAGSQLGFEFVVASAKDADSARASVPAESHSATRGVVVDLTPVLERRAAESDRVLMKAVRSRASHLTDCLLKRP
jgi:hypothetical protein